MVSVSGISGFSFWFQFCLREGVGVFLPPLALTGCKKLSGCKGSALLPCPFLVVMCALEGSHGEMFEDYLGFEKTKDKKDRIHHPCLCHSVDAAGASL